MEPTRNLAGQGGKGAYASSTLPQALLINFPIYPDEQRCQQIRDRWLRSQSQLESTSAPPRTLLLHHIPIPNSNTRSNTLSQRLNEVLKDVAVQAKRASGWSVTETTRIVDSTSSTTRTSPTLEEVAKKSSTSSTSPILPLEETKKSSTSSTSPILPLKEVAKKSSTTCTSPILPLEETKKSSTCTILPLEETKKSSTTCTILPLEEVAKKSVITFKQQTELYVAHYPLPWCSTCKAWTHFSDILYEKVDDISVYVAVPLSVATQELICNTGVFGIPTQEEIASFSFLVWTSAPWSLPFCAGLALNPVISYACLRIHSTKQVFVVGSSQLERVAAIFNAHGLSSSVVGTTELGSKVAEMVNNVPSLFDPCGPETSSGSSVRILTSDQVSASIGTGIVHLVPGCDPFDFVLGCRFGLPSSCPVDDDGCVSLDSVFNRLSTLQASEWVLQWLSQHSQFHSPEKISHKQPFCRFCSTRLLTRSSSHLFMNLSCPAANVADKPRNNGKTASRTVRSNGHAKHSHNPNPKSRGETRNPRKKSDQVPESTNLPSEHQSQSQIPPINEVLAGIAEKFTYLPSTSFKKQFVSSFKQMASVLPASYEIKADGTMEVSNKVICGWRIGSVAGGSVTFDWYPASFLFDNISNDMEANQHLFVSDQGTHLRGTTARLALLTLAHQSPASVSVVLHPSPNLPEEASLEMAGGDVCRLFVIAHCSQPSLSLSDVISARSQYLTFRRFFSSLLLLQRNLFSQMNGCCENRPDDPSLQITCPLDRFILSQLHKEKVKVSRAYETLDLATAYNLLRQFVDLFLQFYFPVKFSVAPSSVASVWKTVKILVDVCSNLMMPLLPCLCQEVLLALQEVNCMGSANSATEEWLSSEEKRWWASLDKLKDFVLKQLNREHEQLDHVVANVAVEVDVCQDGYNLWLWCKQLTTAGFIAPNVFAQFLGIKDCHIDFVRAVCRSEDDVVSKFSKNLKQACQVATRGSK